MPDINAFAPLIDDAARLAILSNNMNTPDDNFSPYSSQTPLNPNIAPPQQSRMAKAVESAVGIFPKSNAAYAGYILGVRGTRHRNTILKGGFGDDPEYIGGMIPRLTPQSIFRSSSQQRMLSHGQMPGTGFLYEEAKMKHGERIEAGPGRIGRRLEKRYNNAANTAARAAGEEQDEIIRTAQKTGVLSSAGEAQHVVDPNLPGRILSMNKLTRGAGSPEEFANVGSYIKRANPDMARLMEPMHSIGGSNPLGKFTSGITIDTSDEAATALGMSARSAMGQYIGGFTTRNVSEETVAKFGGTIGEDAAKRFIAGRAFGELGEEAAQKGVMNVAKEQVLKKAGKEVTGRAIEGVSRVAAMRMAPEVALANAAAAGEGFLNPVADAAAIAADIYTAYQTAKALGSLTNALGGAVVGTVEKGFKSFMGQGFQNPMGGGTYVDNTVSATARARGVMAIQNSRMNARSALGSESTFLHAHFG